MKKGTKTEKSKYPETKFKTKFVNGTRYMICQNSLPEGKYFRNKICDTWSPVGNNAVSVVCYKCIMSMVEPPKPRPVVEKSDKPRGWKFMKEFVDVEGNVYHKGIVQPSLFGTLNPTVIEAKPDKYKLSKKEKDELLTSVGSDVAALKSKLFSETRKGERAKITKELNQKTKQMKKLM